MKYLTHIFYLFLCLLGCSKEARVPQCFDPSFEPGPNAGISEAMTNFMNWNALTLCDFGDNDSTDIDLYISVSIINNCDVYTISLRNIPLGEEEVDLSLNGITAEFYILHGGDAVAEEHVLLKDQTNYLNFRKIDQNAISGEYSLNFGVSPESVGKGLYTPSFPDTLIFKDGVFSVPFPR